MQNELQPNRAPVVGRRGVVVGTAIVAGSAAIGAATNGGAAWAAPAVRRVLGVPPAAASGAGTFAVRVRFVGEYTTEPNAKGVSAIAPAEVVLENVGVEEVPIGSILNVSTDRTSQYASTGAFPEHALMAEAATRASGAPSGVEHDYNGHRLLTPLAPGDVLRLPMILFVYAGRENPWLTDSDPHNVGSDAVGPMQYVAAFITSSPADVTRPEDAVATRPGSFSSTITPPYKDLDLSFEGSVDTVRTDGSILRGPQTLVLRRGVGTRPDLYTTVLCRGPFSIDIVSVEEGGEDDYYSSQSNELAPWYSLKLPPVGGERRFTVRTYDNPARNPSTDFTATLLSYDIAQTGRPRAAFAGVLVDP